MSIELKAGMKFVGINSGKTIVIVSIDGDIIEYYYDIYPEDLKGTERTFTVLTVGFFECYRPKDAK